MFRPLKPGVRRKGKNNFKVSQEYLEEDRERLGEEEFNRRMEEPETMKYGGMKKKKKLKTKKAMLGMMMVGKTMKDEKKPMPIAGAASMAKLDVMKKMLGMKHGGMHKKKKVIKAKEGVYNYGLPDRPEVAKTEKEIKEKYKNISDNPKRDIAASFKRQGFKDVEAKADRFIKAVNNAGARIRTATEGSMKTGGMAKARGTGIAIRGTKFKGIF